ncbi:MAG: hypothetical protein JW871_01930 [Endomicrobiales bacterium]|nr:hypothetical protein [Endomicrobiales bacterium]
MKKFSTFVLLISIALVNFLGCATVKVEAPMDKTIVLQPNVEGQTKLMRKKVWYFLYGLVPLNSNSTASMVQEMDINEMSVRTFYGFDDGLITFILNLIPTTINVKTVEIRGE